MNGGIIDIETVSMDAKSAAIKYLLYRKRCVVQDCCTDQACNCIVDALKQLEPDCDVVEVFVGV